MPKPKDRERRVPPKLKRRLLAEAGGKCANPGCAIERVEYHHIKHWAVYRAHDTDHMIAVCPTCHDYIHHGSLPIDDDTIYAWKSIERPARRERISQLFVEPASSLKMRAGALAFETECELMTLFALGNGSTLGFKVLDGDLLQLSSVLVGADGRQLLRVVDNVVRVHNDPLVVFQSRPGRATVSAPMSGGYFPDWFRAALIEHDSSLALAGARLDVFDAEVTGPGLARVTGAWADEAMGLLIDRELLRFWRRGWPAPCALGVYDDSTGKPTEAMATVRVVGEASVSSTVVQMLGM